MRFAPAATSAPSARWTISAPCRRAAILSSSDNTGLNSGRMSRRVNLLLAAGSRIRISAYLGELHAGLPKSQNTSAQLVNRTVIQIPCHVRSHQEELLRSSRGAAPLESTRDRTTRHYADSASESGADPPASRLDEIRGEVRATFTEWIRCCRGAARRRRTQRTQKTRFDGGAKYLRSEVVRCSWGFVCAHLVSRIVHVAVMVFPAKSVVSVGGSAPGRVGNRCRCQSAQGNPAVRASRHGWD